MRAPSPGRWRWRGALAAAMALAAACEGTVDRRGDPDAPWPPPNLTLITHSSAGGGGDLVARELGRTLEAMYETTVNVENRVGGSGAVATAYVVTRAPQDGSVLQVVTPTQLITPLYAPGIPTYREVTPIIRLLIDPTAVYVRGESPYGTIEELLAAARSSPGGLTWGFGSAGSIDRLIVEEIEDEAGIEVRSVPHEGGGDAMITVLGGHVDAGLGEPGNFGSQLRSGNLRILTILGGDRHPDFPDVPAFSELGYSVENQKFRGVWGPPGLSSTRVREIADALARALETEPFRTYYVRGGMRPAILVGDEFGVFLDAQDERLRRFIANR